MSLLAEPLAAEPLAAEPLGIPFESAGHEFLVADRGVLFCWFETCDESDGRLDLRVGVGVSTYPGCSVLLGRVQSM